MSGDLTPRDARAPRELRRVARRRLHQLSPAWLLRARTERKTHSVIMAERHLSNRMHERTQLAHMNARDLARDAWWWPKACHTYTATLIADRSATFAQQRTHAQVRTRAESEV